MEQNWLINIFFAMAIACLGMVTIGVGYLTVTDWREKQMAQQETKKK